MKTHRQVIAEWEKTDPEFAEARRELEPEFELRRALVRARVARGLTQEQLAEQLGTSQSAIARLERGTWTPRVNTLQRLAQVLGIEFKITPDVALVVSRPGRRHGVLDRGHSRA